MSFNRCGKTHSIHIPCKAHNEQLDHSIHHHYNKELLLVIRSLACLLACEWVRSAWSSSSYAIIITIIPTSIQICESWCGCKVSSHSPLPQAQPPLSGHHCHQRQHHHHQQRHYQQKILSSKISSASSRSSKPPQEKQVWARVSKVKKLKSLNSRSGDKIESPNKWLKIEKPQ